MDDERSARTNAAARVVLHWVALDRVDGVRAALPPDELARAERFRRPELARRWAAARASLRRVLAAEAGLEPAALRFVTGLHGKPRLPAGPEFNLSHCGALALIAVAEVPVGVDVEAVANFSGADAELAERVLDADARARWARLPDAARAAALCREWTCREAYLKATGLGLEHSMSALSLPPGGIGAVADPKAPGHSSNALTPIPAPEGHAAAVCVLAPRLRFETRTLPAGADRVIMAAVPNGRGGGANAPTVCAYMSTRTQR